MLILSFGRSHEPGPGCFQAGHRDAERGARDVVEADPLEEVDRLRVATVLTAYTQVQVWTGLAAKPGGRGHQGTHAIGVDRLERRHGEDPVVSVGREERRLDVVAREAPGQLGQVVGAEG